jgi:hypothetical protein
MARVKLFRVFFCTSLLFTSHFSLLTFHFSLFTGEETPLACLPSLLRRSSFGYEGRELGPGTADPSARLRACFFNILADRSE